MISKITRNHLTLAYCRNMIDSMTYSKQPRGFGKSFTTSFNMFMYIETSRKVWAQIKTHYQHKMYKRLRRRNDREAHTNS